MEMARELYGSFLSPRFILRKLLSVRAWEDVRYNAHAAKIALGHMWDFRRGGRNLAGAGS
jgi:hypothetical protein